MKSSKVYKYDKIQKPEELGFLEYYMLPEGDQFEYVYRPGDDSFLMLSVLKSELKSFQKNPIIIETGSGSGILSAHINHWLCQSGNQPYLHFSTDISMDACLLSSKYYSHYNLQIQQICTSLLQNISLDLTEQQKSKQIIVIFNPPYVPTSNQELESQHKYLCNKIAQVKAGNISRSQQNNMIAYSYMGGEDGLRVTRKWVVSLLNMSKQRKIQVRGYFIVMGEQGIEQLQEYINNLNKQNKQNNIIAKVEILQKYQKMNQQLYVLMIIINKLD